MQEAQRTIEEFQGKGRYSRYPEYRETSESWLAVPDHWEVKRLKFCVKTDPSKSEVENLGPETEITFLPMKNVSEQGEINHGQTESLEDVIDGYTYFREGDILVAKITPCFENGKGALAEDLKNGIGFGSTEFVVLRPLEELNNEFFYYVTASYIFRQLGEAQMKGAAGQKRVPHEYFQNFPQFLPPEEEQEAIIDFLDRESQKISKLIAKKRELVSLLREQEESLITEVTNRGLSSDVSTKEAKNEIIREIPKNWEESKLGNITIKLTNGYVGPTRDILTDKGVPYIQSTHIKNGEIYFDSEFFVSEEWSEDHPTSKLKEGDVLLTQSGTIVGESAVVREEFDGANCHALIIARPVEEVNSSYLNLFFQSRLGRTLLQRTQTGVTLNHLNTTSVKDVTVPIPPKEEQEKIAKRLELERQEFDATAEQIEKGVELLQEYRTALITEAVTGQIDVRGEV